MISRQQHGGVALTVGEPIVQVGLERVQHADLDAAGQQRIDAGHADVAAHGLEVQVQSAGDRPHRQAPFAQVMELLVPLPGVRDPCLPQRGVMSGRGWSRWRRVG